MRLDKNLVKKSITIDPKLIEKIEDLRTKERPVPSFSTVLQKLAWKGLEKTKRKKIKKKKETEPAQ